MAYCLYWWRAFTLGYAFEVEIQRDLEASGIQSEFGDLIEQYVHWASEWDGALPADVFFGVWADLQTEDRQVELHARIVEGHLQFTAAPSSLLRVRDNRIYLEDGRELIIQLEDVQ